MGKSVILLDGGMGQELVRRSGVAPTSLWSVRVMLDNPTLVETLHIEFIRAGAKVISLNNYTATPARLTRDATMDLFEPIHTSAINIAQSARAKAGVANVQIAGCLPPIMASYKPELTPSAEECLAQYRWLVAAQKDAIDLMFCETMATIREATAAATAAREAGLRTMVSFTLDDENPEQLRSGQSLRAAVEAVERLGVEAISVNCSMPETVTAAMPALVASFAAVGGYANGFRSIAELRAGGTTAGLTARDDITPTAYTAYVLQWVEAGAKIIGGCCEIGPAHIAEIARVLRASGYDITAF